MKMAKYPIETIRHSAAHVMAAAVQKLFGDVKFDIGPATSDGFYYDFDMEHRLSVEDLAAIEDEMKKIVNAHIPFEYSEMSREEAKALLEGKNQPYKLERLADIEEGSKITFYTIGDFADLCRGPHVEHTGQIGAFKLMNVAGSYFRGDENNQMLQRIYGVAFPDKAELNAYLRMLEEAKKRDHRKLGKELELFSFSENVGPGLVLWHPKGAFIRNAFETYWREKHYSNGYDLLYTPHIGQSILWKTSGHLDFYRDAMYSSMEIDEVDYYVKPMNCPFHIEVYKSKLRSYRELPWVQFTAMKNPVHCTVCCGCAALLRTMRILSVRLNRSKMKSPACWNSACRSGRISDLLKSNPIWRPARQKQWVIPPVGNRLSTL